MRQKITINDLKRWQANPPEKRFYVSDILSKLKARINADGTIALVARRRRANGKREWKTFGLWPDVGLAEARTMADEFVAGVQVVTKRDEAKALTTWGDVVDSYLEEARYRCKKWSYQHSLLTKYPPQPWKNRPAQAITRLDVRALLLSVGARAPYQANRLQVAIAAAFNQAVNHGLIERNPIRGMKKLFKEKPRKNILRFDQIRTLWETCEGHDYPASKLVQLLLLTGARRSEILSARWDAISEDRWLDVLENKSDRPHKIYLCDLAMEVLDKLTSREMSPFLFPSREFVDRPLITIQIAKNTIQERADIGEWQLRDLRSTFLTHCVEHCGVLPVIAKVCANHSLPGVTDSNYIERAAYYPACKEAWIKYGELVTGIVRGDVGQVVSIREASRAVAAAGL